MREKKGNVIHYWNRASHPHAMIVMMLVCSRLCIFITDLKISIVLFILLDDRIMCPVGQVLNLCGSLCQRTCEDYLTNTCPDCPDMCALPDCVCPEGMVMYKDQCVDPLECYSLIKRTSFVAC